MANKKWEIPLVQRDESFRTNAKIILTHRLSEILFLIDQFRATHDPERLHELRIALRRFRYPLETFIKVFPRARTFTFLKFINRLQKNAGTARDYDVLISKLHSLEKKFHEHLPPKFFADIEKQKKTAYRSITSELTSFLSDQRLKDFKLLIQYDSLLKRLEEDAPQKRRKKNRNDAPTELILLPAKEQES